MAKRKSTTPVKYGGRKNPAFYRVAEFAWKHRKSIGVGAKKLSNRLWHKTNVPTVNQRGRKRRKNYNAESIQHGDLQLQSFNIKLRKQNKAFKHLGKWLYLDQWTLLSANNEGAQGCFELKPMLIRDQFLNSSVSKGSLIWAQTPYDLNPYRTPPSGQSSSVFSVVPGQPAVSNDDVHLHDIQVMTMVTNHSNVPVNIDLFFFKCKKGTANGPLGVWQNAVAEKALGQGASTNPSTVTGVGSSIVPGSVSITTYGMTPMVEKKFREHYGVLKRFRFVLQAGGTKELLYKVMVNKSFNKTTMTDAPFAVANQTIWPFIVYRPGQAVVSDSSVKDVTIAKAEIGVAQTLRYTWSAQAAARLELDRVFPQFVSGTHVENMVLDTDVIGSVAQA